MSSIEKLIAISSAELGKMDNVSIGKREDTSVYRELWKLLQQRNGFYTFESALHVFPIGKQESVMDIESWNSEELWKYEYGNLADGYFCFAEDIFGMQFCIHYGSIHLFDSETAHSEEFAGSIEEWADRILQEYEVWTGYPLAHQWQELYGPMPAGKRLFPKIPFVGGGDFSIDNLYIGDAIEGMRARGAIAQQIHDLPDGTTIEFTITE